MELHSGVREPPGMVGGARAARVLRRPVLDSETTGFVSLRDHNGPAGEAGAAIGAVIA